MPTMIFSGAPQRQEFPFAPAIPRFSFYVDDELFAYQRGWNWSYTFLAAIFFSFYYISDRQHIFTQYDARKILLAPYKLD